MRKWNRWAKRLPYNTRSMLVFGLFGMADELTQPHFFASALRSRRGDRSTLSRTRLEVRSAAENSDSNNENFSIFLELRVRNSVVTSARSTPANRQGDHAMVPRDTAQRVFSSDRTG
jgi:hypothetical protein